MPHVNALEFHHGVWSFLDVIVNNPCPTEEISLCPSKKVGSVLILFFPAMWLHWLVRLFQGWHLIVNVYQIGVWSLGAISVCGTLAQEETKPVWSFRDFEGNELQGWHDCSITFRLSLLRNGFLVAPMWLWFGFESIPVAIWTVYTSRHWVSSHFRDSVFEEGFYF